MPAANATAVAWALRIPMRPELRGVLVTIAGLAGEADNTLRRETTTLCHELKTEQSMLRRYLGYLEDVGAIARQTKRGPGAVQILRVCLEVSPSEVYANTQRLPWKPSEQKRVPRTPARNSYPEFRADLHESQNSVQQFRAGVSRSAAPNSELRAAVSRSPARNERAPLPGRLINNRELNKPANALNTGEGLSSETLDAVNRYPGCAWHETPPPPDVLTELHATWDTKFPEGAQEVTRRLNTAIAHESRKKSSAWLPYLDGWLQQDFDRLPAPARRNGTAAASANNPMRYGPGSELHNRFAALQEESRRAGMPRPVEELAEKTHADAG